MGLLDILEQNKLDYETLTKILYSLNEIVEFDVNELIDSLDEIYTEAVREETINWLKSRKRGKDGCEDCFGEDFNFDVFTSEMIFELYDHCVLLEKKTKK